jgi:glycerol kinase
MTELILALDVGTTGVRSMVFDTEGVVLARAYKEFESSYPKPSWVEQNAQIWWDTACVTTKQCLKKAGVSAERICGLSVTNQRETIVPIDDAGNPLRSAIVWQDRRTVPQWILTLPLPRFSG